VAGGVAEVDDRGRAEDVRLRIAAVRPAGGEIVVPGLPADADPDLAADLIAAGIRTRKGAPVDLWTDDIDVLDVNVNKGLCTFLRLRFYVVTAHAT